MNEYRARFRFYEELNDFLSAEKRKQEFEYFFHDHPSVKDAIEANGVPHTEVDVILVNGESVDFNYQLQDGDRIAVYPVFESFDVSTLTRLRQEPLRKTAFVLDVHLGKLSRLLRMMGFDTVYRNDLEDREIMDIAEREHRIILTRDRGILKHKRVTHGLCVQSTDPTEQVRKVLIRFDLLDRIRPFSRCITCNGPILPVAKAAIQHLLPPETRRVFDRFYQCQRCGHVYWPGSHYERMKEKIQHIIEPLQNRGDSI